MHLHVQIRFRRFEIVLNLGDRLRYMNSWSRSQRKRSVGDRALVLKARMDSGNGLPSFSIDRKLLKASRCPSDLLCLCKSDSRAYTSAYGVPPMTVPSGPRRISTGISIFTLDCHSVYIQLPQIDPFPSRFPCSANAPVPRWPLILPVSRTIPIPSNSNPFIDRFRRRPKLKV